MLQRDLYRRQFASITDVKVHDVYGISFTEGETITCTRTDASVGKVANVGIDNQIVQNDFDNTPLFGSIREVEDDYGNKFVRIPKLYIKKTVDGANRTFQISLTKRPGFYRPWCFWDFANGRELPYIDVGTYDASLSADGKRLESKPGKYPLVSKNIVEFRNYATASGPGYQQLDIHVVDVLRTLAFIEFATVDIQAIMQGYTTGVYSASYVATVTEANANRVILANAHANLFVVGQSIGAGTSLGGNQIFDYRTIESITEYDASNKALNFDGAAVNMTAGNIVYNTGFKSGVCDSVTASSGILTANNGKYPCKYRGIENPFGNVWQFVDGVNINDRQAWVCKNAAQYASNVFANPYEKLPYVNCDENGYVVSMGVDLELPFAEFCVAKSSNNVGYKDYYYQDMGQRVARFGGAWVRGSRAGVSCWALSHSSSDANADFGGRLLKKAL